MRVAVFSTFDITPPSDGGKTRFTEIYKNVAKYCDVQIIAYGSDPVPLNEYKLAPRLEVRAFGSTAPDYNFLLWNMEHTGLYLHDALCVADYSLSPEFVEATRFAVAHADVVIASHPYLAPLAFSMDSKRCQIKVYESHNVEADLKFEYFNTSADQNIRARLLADVTAAERLAVNSADLVTAVSAEDAARLCVLYGAPDRKVRVVPNGVDAELYWPMSGEEKIEFRRLINVEDDCPLAVFLGSAYSANIESYKKTRTWLHQAGFTGAVVLLGSICDAPVGSAAVGFREIRLGYVVPEVKAAAIGAADFAVQFIFSGGGTNLKLFDYMASGTPVVANDFGARGVAGRDWFCSVNSVDELREFLATEGWKSPAARASAASAMALARGEYDWSSIGARMASLIGATVA